MSPDSRQALPRSPGMATEPDLVRGPVQHVDGLELDREQARSGDDTRKRGWFWHWNAIVTQFAPLIGLKGVGLLNSYTVWTDRREESPHRGYAFPTQQSEADFYGEDRSELITINKILVALDLIEIRKEMVLRVDESGHRWRVPHNLYRVKDREDGFSLTAPAVDRVVQLAARDRAVYRYVRHIFSPKFKPIDANNVWASILESLAATPSWELLAARTALEEARASARTKAGHKSRKTATALAAVDQETPAVTGSDSRSVGTDTSMATIVEASNNGSGIDVERSNRGSRRISRTSVATSNADDPTDVAPSNTTYHQDKTTTTTQEKEEQILADVLLSVAPQQMSYGPGGMEAPVDRAAQERALRTFFEANHREATMAERKLLNELAVRFEPAARTCLVPELGSGWRWVNAAILDAVDAGSAYVAPRRVREILVRWEREGPPGSAQQEPAGPAEAIELGTSRGIHLPHGHDSGSTWAYIVKLLGVVIEPRRLVMLVGGSAIAGFEDDAVVIEASSVHQARALDGEYRELVVRKLSEAMRRPVGLRVVHGGIQDTRSQMDSGTSRVARSSFFVPEIGLTSAQVWDAVVEDVVRTGEIRRSDAIAWLRPAALIDRSDNGAFIIGAPNAITAKRLGERFARPIATALDALLGSRVVVDVVVAQDWMPDARTRESDSSLSA